MSFGIFNSYPVGWVNPVVLRASAALPAAGVWDATPTEQNIVGASALTLTFTYTRGAAGGAFDWQLQVSPYSIAALVPVGTGEWFPQSLYAAGMVVAGADSASLVQRELQTYTSQGVAAETFVFGPISLEGVERVRVVARESGVIGTPGTLAITTELQP